MPSTAVTLSGCALTMAQPYTALVYVESFSGNLGLYDTVPLLPVDERALVSLDCSLPFAPAFDPAQLAYDAGTVTALTYSVSARVPATATLTLNDEAVASGAARNFTVVNGDNRVALRVRSRIGLVTEYALSLFRKPQRSAAAAANLTLTLPTVAFPADPAAWSAAFALQLAASLGVDPAQLRVVNVRAAP